MPFKAPPFTMQKKQLFDYRLPLEASISLTYRCNNNCLHCWLRIHPEAIGMRTELSSSEIIRIVDEARNLGTKQWNISGGEPMLRSDFLEIFDYITRKAVSYTLNTNGTLITPHIARMLTRKGAKLVALYGATKETYDHVTRNPGGFEQLMQGFRYLKEAGAGFIVQLIPMKDNWHEWEKMKELAQSLSPHVRIGASWLYLSSSRDPLINAEISRQRLDPKVVAELDKQDFYTENFSGHQCGHKSSEGNIFSSCIANRRDFNVDPYGYMSFCSFLKDPSMLYDLRKGTVREGWEVFIPSLSEKKFESNEYNEKCGLCDLRSECRWCAVYSWLEHGRFSAPIEYLCEITLESKRLKDDWLSNHRRFYKIAGITIRVESDLPIDDNTFNKKFSSFRVDTPDDDTVNITHHFGLPDLKGQNLGKELVRIPPWAIYRKNEDYIYLGISAQKDDTLPYRLAIITADHKTALIYNDDVREKVWRDGDVHSLTMFPTDQIIIARLLADRQGFYLHSAGAIINGAGVLFVGHSDAGKSTITNLLIDEGSKRNMQVEILCDDRNIVRRIGDGWQVFGTWSHGDVPFVSSANAPFRAICFIEQATENALIQLTDTRQILSRLLACVIQPLITADWWKKTLDLIDPMVKEVPSYVMRFDKSGLIVGEIEKMIMLDNNEKV